MSAGHLSREFKPAYSEWPYGNLKTRRIERVSLGTFSTRHHAWRSG